MSASIKQYARVLISCTFLCFNFSYCKKAATDPGMSGGTIVSGNTASKSWLALGDSYTIGESVNANETFPVQTVQILKSKGVDMLDPEIIAKAGWTTDDLWYNIKDKRIAKPYDIVTLLIGVNNQYQGGGIDNYKTGFTQILMRSIEFAGGNASRVIVISIPDYSVTPFAKNSDRDKIAHEIDAFNLANKQIADQYQVGYLNVTDDSRMAASDASLIASDSLHFSGKEYRVWSDKLTPVIKSLMQ